MVEGEVGVAEEVQEAEGDDNILYSHIHSSSFSFCLLFFFLYTLSQYNYEKN